MKFFASLIFIVFLASSCGAQYKESSEQSFTTTEAAVAYDEGGASGTSAEISSEEGTIKDLKIIKTGNLQLKVEDLKEATDAIKGISVKYKCILSSESRNNSPYRVEQSMVFRVSNDRFEALAKELSEIGYVENYSATGTDVTEEYMDVEGRLATKREMEKRYTEFLKSAKNVDEMLKIERELRTLREEIESKEGRLRYLKDRVALSTLSVSVYQQKDGHNPPPQSSFFTRLWKEIADGWDGLEGFVLAMVRIWPFWVIVSVAGYFIRKWLKNRKK